MVTGAVYRSIQAAPNMVEADALAEFYRQVGVIFCEMPKDGNFTYAHFVTRLEKIPSPLLGDDYVLDVRALITSLYKIAYRDRLRAELSPERWLLEHSQLFCDAISAGLKDAGRAGVN